MCTWEPLLRPVKSFRNTSLTGKNDSAPPQKGKKKTQVTHLYADALPKCASTLKCANVFSFVALFEVSAHQSLWMRLRAWMEAAALRTVAYAPRRRATARPDQRVRAKTRTHTHTL